MDRQAYIIHSSELIQNSLSDLLRINFRCTVHSNHPDKINENIVFDDIASSFFFIEHTFHNSIWGKNLIRNYPNSCIEISAHQTQHEHFSTSFSIYDSESTIIDKLKPIFNLGHNSDETTESLTNREQDVLKLVALGHANKEIADKLFISTHTVMSHRKNITEKLRIKSISGLTVYAIINKLIPMDQLNSETIV